MWGRRGTTPSTKQQDGHITASLIPRLAAVETSARRFHGAAVLGTTFMHAHQGCEQDGGLGLPADIWTFPPSADSVRYLIGYAVVAVNGRVGTIDQHSLRADSCYLVVDTGWWIFERKRLIPAGLISSISGPDHTIYLAMTKRSVRSAPVYKPIEHSSASGRYNDFYGNS
jgi:hypothetical protein